MSKLVDSAVKDKKIVRGVFIVIGLLIIGIIYLFWTTIKGWFGSVGALGDSVKTGIDSVTGQLSGQDYSTTPNYATGNWSKLIASPSSNPLSSAYSSENQMPSVSSVQPFIDSFNVDFFPSFWEGFNPDNWITLNDTIVSLFESVPTKDDLAVINSQLVAEGNNLMSALGGHLSQNVLDEIATIIQNKN